MATTTIARYAFTDDTGDGESGDILNAALIGAALYDKIDALLANHIVFAGTITERGRTAAMGEWTAYTPALTNITLGNGTLTAKYTRVGKKVSVNILLAFGSTTTITAAARFSLPVNNTATSAAQSLGSVGMFDVSASALYLGPAVVYDNANCVIYAQASPLSLVSATVPFTWATGDHLCVTLEYQEP